MKLRVNLYQTALQPKLDKLPLSLWLRMLAMVFLLLSGAMLWLQLQVQQQQQQAQQTEALLQQKMQELETYQQALLNRQPQPALQQQVTQHQQSVQQKMLLVQYLERETNAPLPDYAGIFAHLSAIDPQGLWLTHFQLGAHQQFSGVVQQGAVLPLWLKQLGQHPALQGKSFAEIRIQPQDNDAYLQFSVRSTAVGSSASSAPGAASAVASDLLLESSESTPASQLSQGGGQ